MKYNKNTKNLLNKKFAIVKKKRKFKKIIFTIYVKIKNLNNQFIFMFIFMHVKERSTQPLVRGFPINFQRKQPRLNHILIRIHLKILINIIIRRSFKVILRLRILRKKFQRRFSPKIIRNPSKFLIKIQRKRIQRYLPTRRFFFLKNIFFFLIFLCIFLSS